MQENEAFVNFHPPVGEELHKPARFGLVCRTTNRADLSEVMRLGIASKNLKMALAETRKAAVGKHQETSCHAWKTPKAATTARDGTRSEVGNRPQTKFDVANHLMLLRLSTTGFKHRQNSNRRCSKKGLEHVKTEPEPRLPRRFELNGSHCISTHSRASV